LPADSAFGKIVLYLLSLDFLRDGWLLLKLFFQKFLVGVPNFFKEVFIFLGFSSGSSVLVFEKFLLLSSLTRVFSFSTGYSL